MFLELLLLYFLDEVRPPPAAAVSYAMLHLHVVWEDNTKRASTRAGRHFEEAGTHLSRVEVGFLMSGEQDPAAVIRLLLIKAGDIEQNPGPNQCNWCNKAIRTGQEFLTCKECRNTYHKQKKCAQIPRNLRLQQDFQCGRCRGMRPEMEEDREDTRGEEGIEGPKSCNQCKKNIRRNINPVICNQCKNYYHMSCTEIERKKQRNTDWKSWKCLQCGNVGAKRNEDVVEQEERKKRCYVCKKMGMNIKIKCRGCNRYIHKSCTGLSRVEADRIEERNSYICNECKNQPRRREDAGDSQKAGKDSKEKTKRRKLTILQWNSDGINTKSEELKEKLKEWEVDIAMIQETHLQPSNNSPDLGEYEIIRRDRSSFTGKEGKGKGGLITAIKRELVYDILDEKKWIEEEDVNTEMIAVKVHINEEKTLRCLNVYIPPFRQEDNDNRTQKFNTRKLPTGRGTP